MRKTILITGAGTRLGKQVATALSEDGWRIAIHYNRSRGKAKELVRTLPTQCVAVGGNLVVPAQRDSLIRRAVEGLGTPLTALINNASTYDPDTAEDFTSASYDHHFDINLKAALILSRDFAKALPQKESGCIINMIDQRVLRPNPDFFTYHLSKTALLEATKTMAQTFAPRIRVNGIGPGPSLKNIHQSEAEFNKELKSTLLGIGSPPETIVQGIKYLLAARAVTGQMIAVDGGEHLKY